MERAKLISPTHPGVLYWAGFLELLDGRTTAACASWQQCLRFSDEYTKQILDAAHQAFPSSAVVNDVLPMDPRILLKLATRYYGNNDQSAERCLVLDRADVAIAQVNLPQAEQYYLRASVNRLQKAPSAAINNYDRAIQLDPMNTKWRHEFAEILFQEGQFQQALGQATAASTLEPENRKYSRLLKKILHRLQNGTD